MESKHLLSILCLMTCMLLAGTVAKATDAYEYTYAGATLKYTLDNGEAHVGDGNPNAIVTIPKNNFIAIPAKIIVNGTTYPVTAICDFAFDTSTSSLSISVPSNVKAIGLRAFNQIENLYLPSSITSIKDYAFTKISKLYIGASTSPTITNLVDYTIGKLYILSGSKSSYDSNFPKVYGTITEIDATKEITVNSVTYTIDPFTHRAIFKRGYDVDNIPSYITYSSSDGYDGTYIVDEIGSLGIMGNETSSLNYNPSTIKTLSIPNTITTLDVGALSLCTNLESLTIPESVISIEGCGLSQASKLSALYMLPVCPPTIAASDIPSNTTIYIPDGSTSAATNSTLETYKAASNWSQYSSNMKRYFIKTFPSYMDYSTICLPYNATIPEGVTAYYASSINNSQITLTQISSTIPANTGCIIKGSAGYKYNFLESSSSVSPISGNCLTGNINSDATKTVLSLGYNSNDNLGFYKSGSTISANSAYLDLSASADGSGLTIQNTDEDKPELDTDGYYMIATANDLAWFRNYVNRSHNSANAKLTNDIDLSALCDMTGERNWVPIGISSSKYCGTFDGCQHTVSGLCINNTDDYQGLFGYVCDGTIKNLTVKGNISANSYVGGITGALESKDKAAAITNCNNYTTINGSSKVGGITGYMTNSNVTYTVSITKCNNNAAISGSENIGGILGLANIYHEKNSIMECTNTSTVTGEKCIGGIVGNITLSYETAILYISSCYNTNTINGNSNVGGICGGIQQGVAIIIKNNYNYSSVIGTSNAGTLIGYCGSSLMLTNDYYLNTSNSVIGYIKGTGTTSEVVSNNTHSMTASDFSSGKTARLLNGGDGTTESATGTWGQTIGTDQYPVFMTDNNVNAVYKATINGTCFYGNKELLRIPESYIYNNANINGLYKDDDSFCGTLTYTLDGDVVLKTKLYKDMSSSENITADGYYKISNSLEMGWLRYYVNAGNTGTNARLVNNIDLSDVCGEKIGNWTPIGNSSKTYSGKFDGGGYAVNGLYINNAGASYQGLFGYTKGVTISNLSVLGSVTGLNYIGGIVGYMSSSSTISKCCTSVSIVEKASGPYIFAGGIAGFVSNSKINNCYSYGIKQADTNGSIAGVLINNSSLSNCFDNSSSKYLVYTSLNNSTSTPSPTNNCYSTSGYAIRGTLSSCTFYTPSTDDLASGKITRLLNGGSNTTESASGAWGQILGTDNAPVLMTANNANAVYSITVGESKNYANTGKEFALPASCTFSGTKISGIYYTDGTDFFTDKYIVKDKDAVLTLNDLDMKDHLVDGYYEISDATQMNWMAYYVNAATANTNINAKLKNNIDMKSATWTAMGSFAGIFDGGGNTISSMGDGKNSNANGFVNTLTGTVKYLSFDNAKVFCHASATGSAVIASNNKGTIEQCIVKNSTVQEGNYDGLGGIAGYNNGTIDNCGVCNTTFVRNYSGAKNKDAGALTQYNNNTVKNCYTYGCSYTDCKNAAGMIMSGNAPTTVTTIQ